MPADVALAERAEHRVAKRMNHHIAVGVRDDAAVCRAMRTPPSIDMIAVAERMHVEPLADSHFAGIVRLSAAFQYARRGIEILRRASL